MQDPWVVGKMFGSFPSNLFTQPFQYFQIVNVVDCLSSWYKFIMNNPSNIKFANFIVTPRTVSFHLSTQCHNPEHNTLRQQWTPHIWYTIYRGSVPVNLYRVLPPVSVWSESAFPKKYVYKWWGMSLKFPQMCIFFSSSSSNATYKILKLRQGWVGPTNRHVSFAVK